MERAQVAPFEGFCDLGRNQTPGSPGRATRGIGRAPRSDDQPVLVVVGGGVSDEVVLLGSPVSVGSDGVVDGGGGTLLGVVADVVGFLLGVEVVCEAEVVRRVVAVVWCVAPPVSCPPVVAPAVSVGVPVAESVACCVGVEGAPSVAVLLSAPPAELDVDVVAPVPAGPLGLLPPPPTIATATPPMASTPSTMPAIGSSLRAPPTPDLPPAWGNRTRRRRRPGRDVLAEGLAGRVAQGVQHPGAHARRDEGGRQFLEQPQRTPVMRSATPGRPSRGGRPIQPGLDGLAVEPVEAPAQSAISAQRGSPTRLASTAADRSRGRPGRLDTRPICSSDMSMTSARSPSTIRCRKARSSISRFSGWSIA